MIQFLQKSIAGFLIFIALANMVLVIFIYHKQAQAFNPFVWDIPHTVATIGGWIKSGLAWVWDKAKWVIDKAWDKVKFLWEKRQTLKDWLWKTTEVARKKSLSVARKKLLDYTVQHLANYIQYGGREGGPSFIPDWRKFLYEGKGSVLDQAAGEFANTFWQNITAELTPEVQAAMESAGISTTNLCEIDPGSWTNLIIQAGTEPVKKFTSKDVACTITEAGETLLDAKQKLQKFYDGDFNWDTWLKIQEPQNNVYGFYLTVLDKKAGIEGEKIEAEKSKAIASTGWLGKERCVTYVDNTPEGAKLNRPKATIQYDSATGLVSNLIWLTTWNELKKPLTFNLKGENNPGELIFRVASANDAAKILFNPTTGNGKYVFPIGLDREQIAITDGGIIFDALKDPNTLGTQGMGFTCTNYETITPGQVIGQTVAKHFGGEIDWLMSTDEMEKYSTALATAGINRLFSEGVGLLGRWFGDDEDKAKTSEDDYQKFLASLPSDTRSDIKTRSEASGKAFDTAQKDYRKLTGYQESVADDKKQENVVAAADTPAGELLYALLDLENALKKLKTSQEALLKLQDLNLKAWQEKALSALLAYHITKNVYYWQRFGRQGQKPTEDQKDKCYNEEIEREYNIDYIDESIAGGTCPSGNPVICEGADNNDVAGMFIYYEKFDLLSKNLGEIINVSFAWPFGYNQLDYTYFPKPDYCDAGAPNYQCAKYKEGTTGNMSQGKAIIHPEITGEEQEKIQRLIDSIGSTAEKKGWLGNILAARDKIREKVHLGQFSYLDLQRIYLAIYNWATSIDSQDKTILTELELQGLERLNGIWSHLVNWQYQTLNDLKTSLEKDEYAKTQEFISQVEKITQTCKDDSSKCTKTEEEAKKIIKAMADEAKVIYDSAMVYAFSPESPAGEAKNENLYKKAFFEVDCETDCTKLENQNEPVCKVVDCEKPENKDYPSCICKPEYCEKRLVGNPEDASCKIVANAKKINFYKEFIGLNRFANALVDNEPSIILAGTNALASTSAELNKDLGIKPYGEVGDYTNKDSCEKAKYYWYDNICHEDSKGTIKLTLSDLIQEVRKVEEVVKEKVADIEAGFRELTFEKSTPDITPTAVYQNKLKSIMETYNRAYENWKECKDWLENKLGPGR